MALTATMALDIKAFEGGLKKATASLEGFAEKTIKNTNRELARLMEGFTGQKVAAEASRMAEAVTRIQGPAKLTAQELDHVRATLDAAIAKFDKLGQEVPADIARVRAEITKLDDAAAATAKPSGGLGQWSGALGMAARFLPGLSVAGAVAGITHLASAALDAADRFVNLSNKTGATIETVQRWDRVANETGTTVEAFANSAFKLGVNVSAGSSKARDAISDLGLAYGELRSLKPEDQFARVIEKLEGIESVTDRNRIGTALFGKQFAEIAGAVAEGYTRIAGEAKVAGDAQVRAAEAAGQAWDDLKKTIATVALTSIGNIALEFTETAASLDTLTQAEYEAFVAAQRLGEGHLFLVNLQRERLRGQHDINLATEQGSSTTADYVAKLAAVRAEVAAITPAQRQQIDAALELDGVTEALSDELGVSVEALKMYQSQVKESAKSTKELAAEKSKAAEAAKKFADSVRFAIARLTEFKTVTQDGTTALRNLAAGLNANGTLVERTREEITEAAKATAEWIRQNGLLKGSIEQITPAMLGAGDSTEGFFQRVFGGAEGLGQSVSSIFQGAFMGGGGALGAVKSFATQTLSNLLGMIPGIGQWASAFAGPIVAMLSSLARRFKDFFSGIFGGPSSDERSGRAAVAGFEQELHNLLNSQQEMEAGGEDWKRTIIAIRDAYIAAGRSGEDALVDAKRLWESSRISAEESAKVIEEIRRKMQALPEEQIIEVTAKVNDNDVTEFLERFRRGDYNPDFRIGGPGTTPQSVPSGDAGASRASTLIGASDSPATISAASMRPGFGGATQTINVPIVLDGHQIAMATIPHIPAALRRRGVPATWP